MWSTTANRARSPNRLGRLASVFLAGAALALSGPSAWATHGTTSTCTATDWSLVDGAECRGDWVYVPGGHDVTLRLAAYMEGSIASYVNVGQDLGPDVPYPYMIKCRPSAGLVWMSAIGVSCSHFYGSPVTDVNARVVVGVPGGVGCEPSLGSWTGELRL